MTGELLNSFRFARNVLLLLSCGLAYNPVRTAVRKYMYSDALVELRRQTIARPENYLIRLEGVRMKHYDAKRMLSYAHSDSVEIGTDRHTFNMQGVHDALYQGKEGMFRFSAQHATYMDAASQLTADGLVQVRNKDMNLSARALRFNGNSNHLNVMGHVVGKLKSGDLDVDHVDYRVDNGSYRAGPINWKGPLALDFGQTAQGQNPNEPTKPSIWDIQGETISYTGRGSQIANYSNAVASDGDIILIAPTVVHDRKTDVVTATGRIQYFSAKADMVADQAVIYRREKRAVLTGNVLMLVKPKSEQDGKPKVEKLPPFQPMTPDQVVAHAPDVVTDAEKEKANQLRESKTIRDFPTVMVSAKIEYWYGKGARRAVITGVPQGRQELPNKEWRHVWTNVAYYDGEAETLKLVSTKDKKDTRLKNSIGDDMTADWMEVSTKEDDDKMTGHGFAGHLASLDDEVPKDKKNPLPPPPKVSGGGSPLVPPTKIPPN